VEFHKRFHKGFQNYFIAKLKIIHEVDRYIRSTRSWIEVKAGSFFYSLTPTKEPRLVTFHREVKLKKLDFYSVKLLLGFFVLFSRKKGGKGVYWTSNGF